MQFTNKMRSLQEIFSILVKLLFTGHAENQTRHHQ